MNRGSAEAVRELVLRYADALNLYDLEAFADAFAADGVWDVHPYWKAVGRENVRRTFEKERNAFDWVFQLVHGTRVLSADDRRANARSYVTEHGSRGGKGYFLLGAYHDECVREGETWRFAVRRFDALYLGPPDLSAPPANYPAPRHF